MGIAPAFHLFHLSLILSPVEKQPVKKYTSKADGLLKLQRYCAYQERCHREVRGKLLELGIYGQDLEEIMASLIEENFLNEERYARSFARGKFRIKQWGRGRIRQELKMRDISDYCIRKAMDEIDEGEYRSVLVALIQKQEGAIDWSNDFDRKNKLAQHAIRRGFESEMVWEILNEKDSR